ncbi:hypothetical protein HDV00_007215, partial [Rhizophlyctis rosea]
SKSFGAVTLRDLSNQGGLALNVKNVNTDEIRLKASLILPHDFPRPPSTEHLTRQLERLSRVWSKNSETGRRTFIDAILAEAVDVAFHGRVVDDKVSAEVGCDDEGLAGEEEEEEMQKEVAAGDGGAGGVSEDDVEEEEPGPLRVFTEVELKWEGTKMAVGGTVDYLLGHVEGDQIEEDMKDSYLIAVEAKKEWPENAFIQALAEGGALLRRRQVQTTKAAKEGGVFIVLTNATLWNFYYIDQNGVVYCSGDPITSSHVSEILAWLTFFVKGTCAISPRVSMLSMKEEDKASMRNGIAGACRKLWIKRR